MIASPIEFDAKFDKEILKFKKEQIQINYYLVGQYPQNNLEKFKAICETIKGELIVCEKMFPVAENEKEQGFLNADDDDFELQKVLALSQQEYFESQKKKDDKGQDFGGFM
ncbi:Hypothetical_protein [Hexamita inflata]|uniref:Hypothetical_protein n=1 Tax=Hexamita inflata TaxID=28002 RepID=A0ABP1HKR8_9EUKA